MPTLSGHLLLETADGSAELRPGRVHWQGETISKVETLSSDGELEAEASETLICPGLVDTHLHLPQFNAIGASGMRLLPWLEQVIFPAETRWNEGRVAAAEARRAAERCLAAGTTAVAAYATVSAEATRSALLSLAELGMRGVVGQVLMDRNAPPELLRPADQLIEESAALLEAFPARSRLAAAVTPRFALSCTEGLLKRAGELAASTGAMIQTHLAETEEECRQVSNAFGSRSYVQVYEDAGLLTGRSVMGHGIHLTEADQARLALNESVVAHCPTANSFLGSGTMNRSNHLDQRLRLSLGSDIGAGYEISMVRVGRAMIDAAMRIAMAANPEQAFDSAALRGVSLDDGELAQVPTAAQAWHQITAGNADAMGWQDAGRIREGVPADLVVIRPSIPWLPTRCPLSTLMFGWDDRWVRRTYLSGRLAYESAIRTRDA